MKKIRIILACAVILAISVASSGICAPSFKGYTGLMNIPTADTLTKSSWNAGIFSEDLGSDSTVNDIVANYGIAEKLEVGLDIYKYNDHSGSNVLLNAKYAIRNETSQDVGMAVGVIDATDEVDAGLYFVVSKSFANKLSPHSPRFHAGIGTGGLDGLFAGVSVFLNDNFELMGEYDTNNVNLGARLHITPNVGVYAGFFDVSDNCNLGLGASYAVHY